MKRRSGLLAHIILAAAWGLLAANTSYAVGRVLIARKVGTGNTPPPSPQIAALRTLYARINLWGAVFTGLPIFVLLLDKYPAWRSPPPGHCPHCNYNLTGNVSGLCPECGTTLIRASYPRPAPQAPYH
jgi:predicted RNA-binding Zn-ribbon protein involved in translation (DUF1610 family)